QWGNPPCTKQSINIWKVLFPKIHILILEICSAYFNPVPTSKKQLLILAVECFLLSLTNGILLHKWLSTYLQYDPQSVYILAITVAVFMFCVLMLVHPVRCIFGIIIPSIGTKQGRNFLWSAGFMVIILNILPNIITNIRVVFHAMKCITQHSSESILNSTHVLKPIIEDIRSNINTVKDNLGYSTPRKLNIEASVDTAFISGQILKVSENIKEEFISIESGLREGMVLSNRILAGFFITNLLFSSIWYLKRYLTDLKFDNTYITKQLEMLASKRNASRLLPSSSGWLIKSTGVKLSRDELCTSLVHMLILSIFILFTTLAVVGDHMTYQIAVLLGNTVDKVPEINVTFEVQYYVSSISLLFPHLFSQLDIFLLKFLDLQLHEYQWKMSFASANCLQLPSPPDTSAMVTCGFIYGFMFIVILLEAYAHRLRRKISASFYQKREEERVSYLLEKIMQRHGTVDGNQTLKISIRLSFLAIRLSREQAVRQKLANCRHIRCLFGACSRAVKSP
uniref:Dendritic cell-specific transmembrane protein-like domain-containing protein n=1 Tax=Leptobrachium leishanense TaxID=445787 RepID=A0A8C5Q6W8_9ANUR